MSVENRKAVIEDVLARFDSQIQAPADQIDGIGRRLLPHFIEGMPPAERPNWGVLRKSTGTFPYDILVWRPTREHFDVLTSKEVSPGFRRLQATWTNAGVLPRPDWTWHDWRASGIVPLEETSTEPEPEQPESEPPHSPTQDADVHRKLDFIIGELRDIKVRQDRPFRP